MLLVSMMRERERVRKGPCQYPFITQLLGRLSEFRGATAAAAEAGALSRYRGRGKSIVELMI